MVIMNKRRIYLLEPLLESAADESYSRERQTQMLPLQFKRFSLAAEKS
jgi:hypothetical protein